MNEQTIIKLSEFVNSEVYRQAKDEVMRITTVSVLGTPAAEAGIAMALEKGVRLAFAHIEKLSKPRTHPEPPKPRASLTRSNNNKES